jgi:hypothetical protein
MKKYYLIITLLLLSASPTIFASQIIADHFLRTGVSETLNTPFLSQNGITTHSLFHQGTVEVIVSGVGYSFWDDINDAFFMEDSVAHEIDPGYYQLNAGTNGIPFDGGPDNNIINSIIFIENEGIVNPSSRPIYDPNHEYHFVIDTSLMGSVGNSALTFGVSDIDYADNGGSYNIQLFEVSPTPVPAAFILMLTGIFSLFSYSKRKSITR